MNFQDILRRIQDNDPKLIEADLSHQALGPEQAIQIANALEYNTHLRILNLATNEIGSQGAVAIAAAIQKNLTSSLEMLNLWCNNISTEGVEAISDLLKQNSMLQYLTLGYNPVGDEGAILLADALKINHSLKELILWESNIGDQGAVAIAGALLSNQGLKTLHLGQNFITDHGVVVLANALRANRNNGIQTLGLGDTDFGVAGAKSLAVYLAENIVLNRLDIVNVKIGIDGAQAIFDSLKYNGSVTQLKAEPILYQSAEFILSRNLKLQEFKAEYLTEYFIELSEVIQKLTKDKEKALLREGKANTTEEAREMAQAFMENKSIQQMLDAVVLPQKSLLTQFKNLSLKNAHLDNSQSPQRHEKTLTLR